MGSLMSPRQQLLKSFHSGMSCLLKKRFIPVKEMPSIFLNITLGRQNQNKVCARVTIQIIFLKLCTDH